MPSPGSQGQSLPEYILIGAMVALLSVGGLMLFANGLGDVMDRLLADMKGSDAISSVNAGGNSDGGDELAENLSLDENTTTQNDETTFACLDDGGWCLPDYTPTSLTEVAGANGLSDVLLGSTFVLQDIADRIKDMPDVDPALKDLITLLANQGHSVATSQQTAMDLCEPGTTCSTEAAGQLSNQLGEVVLSAHMFDENYQNLLNYLQSSPEAFPPELQQIIDHEVQTILKIAGAFDTDLALDTTTITQSIWYSWDVEYEVDTVSWDFAYDPGTNEPVIVVTTGSNTVCGSGGDVTECIQH